MAPGSTAGAQMSWPGSAAALARCPLARLSPAKNTEIQGKHTRVSTALHQQHLQHSFMLQRIFRQSNFPVNKLMLTSRPFSTLSSHPRLHAFVSQQNIPSKTRNTSVGGKLCKGPSACKKARTLHLPHPATEQCTYLIQQPSNEFNVTWLVHHNVIAWLLTALCLHLSGWCTRCIHVTWAQLAINPFKLRASKEALAYTHTYTKKRKEALERTWLEDWCSRPFKLQPWYHYWWQPMIWIEMKMYMNKNILLEPNHLTSSKKFHKKKHLYHGRYVSI